MNPLQARLLEWWLGPRDDLCVVGADYQMIYAFTGASPEHLLTFTERFPDATVVRLRGQLPLDAGDPRAGEPTGAAPRRVPQDASGDEGIRAAAGGARRARRGRRGRDVASAARRLHDEEAVPFEEIAVLYRINARSEPFEEAFAAAGIPYQVRIGTGAQAFERVFLEALEG